MHGVAAAGVSDGGTGDVGKRGDDAAEAGELAKQRVLAVRCRMVEREGRVEGPVTDRLRVVGDGEPAPGEAA